MPLLKFGPIECGARASEDMCGRHTSVIAQHVLMRTKQAILARKLPWEVSVLLVLLVKPMVESIVVHKA